MRKLLKLRRIYLILLFPVSILMTILARSNSFFAEQVYALRLYRWLSQIISLITGLIPISIAEILIITLPFVLIFILIKFIITLAKDKENRRTNALKGIINIICSLSVILFSFTMLGGLNYYRYSFAYYYDLDIDLYTVEELYGLTFQLAKQANELRELTPMVDANGVFELSMSNYELAKEADKAMKNLSEEYPVFDGRYALAKPVLLSPLMSHAEITGIFIPFTMESNVNVHISDYAIPYTMLHEMAHQRGFMREDEANFIAYIAGMCSDNIEIMYSSTMLALISSGNALYRQDSNLYFEIRGTYSEGVVKDIRANTDYWAKYEDTVISTVSNRINDTYLKANSQADGVKSYGRMVDLLLAKYRSEILAQQ